MSISKSANLIIYRIREKGLEVFLVNGDKKQELLRFPKDTTAAEASLPANVFDKIIALDPVKKEDGQLEEAFAVEGDWHDIPSLKGLLLQDVRTFKDQLQQMIPEIMEKGTFVAVKEAFKRVMPHHYEMLKELKDILTDRNSVKNI
jgi:hypothetical protein